MTVHSFSMSIIPLSGGAIDVLPARPAAAGEAEAQLGHGDGHGVCDVHEAIVHG